MRGLVIIGVAALAGGLAGCESTALPSGTLVSGPPPQPIYAPPPVVYAPPPPRARCHFRPGPFGPERICRHRYYY